MRGRRWGEGQGVKAGSLLLLKALNPEIRLKPIEAARGWGGRTRAIAWLCRRAGFGIPDLSA